MPKNTNPTLESITAKKNRIGEQISKLQAHHAELEATERVLSRLSGRQPAAAPKAAVPAPQKTTPTRARGRPRGPAAAKVTNASSPGSKISLNDAIANVVAKHRNGIASPQIMADLQSEYGLSPRPNHLGAGLARHLRGGRLQERAGMWYPPQGMSAGE
jgi:hypothetical protein